MNGLFVAPQDDFVFSARGGLPLVAESMAFAHLM